MSPYRLCVLSCLPFMLISACIAEPSHSMHPEIEENADIETGEQPIVDGWSADEGEYPFMVSIQLSWGSTSFHICGGSVVAPRFILTAAHCVEGHTAANLRVVMGRTVLSDIGTGITMTPTEIIIHPAYETEPGYSDNDVAVLRLPANATVAPVDLASPYGPSDRANWQTGDVATVIGWGALCYGCSGTNFLQEVTVGIASDSYAASMYGSDYNPAVHLVAGWAACDNDNGGPLFVNSGAGFQQIGTVSWGGCDDEPNVYTRIGAQPLHRWLKSVIHETPAVGDVNGDGKDDIVTFTHGDSSWGPLDVWVALSDGTKFGASSIWQDWWAHRGNIPMLGDFNGDGKEDIWSFGNTDVWVAISTGTSFNGGVYTKGSISSRAAVPRVGDVNGDGKDDVVLFANDGTGDVYVLLSTGSGWGSRTKWHDWFAPEGETPMLADVNGDGKDDILTFAQGMNGNQVYVALSDGTKFGAAGSGVWHSYFALSTEMPGVGRFNSDNKADIVTFTRNAFADVWVGLSNGSSFSAGGGKWHGGFGSDHATLLVGDVNGDGKDDVVEFTQDAAADVFVALSTGSSFGARVLWHAYFAP